MAPRGACAVGGLVARRGALRAARRPAARSSARHPRGARGDPHAADRAAVAGGARARNIPPRLDAVVAQGARARPPAALRRHARVRCGAAAARRRARRRAHRRRAGAARVGAARSSSPASARWRLFAAVASWALPRAPAAAAAATVTAAPPPRPEPPSVSVTSTRRITFDPGCEEYPSFTPTGARSCSTASWRTTTSSVRSTSASGTTRRLTHEPGWDYGGAVSPDGKWIAYVHTSDAGREIRVLPIEGDRAGAPSGWGCRGRDFPSWTHDGAVLVGEGEEILRFRLDTEGAHKETTGAPAVGRGRPLRRAVRRRQSGRAVAAAVRGQRRGHRRDWPRRSAARGRDAAARLDRAPRRAVAARLLLRAPSRQRQRAGAAQLRRRGRDGTGRRHAGERHQHLARRQAAGLFDVPRVERDRAPAVPGKPPAADDRGKLARHLAGARRRSARDCSRAIARARCRCGCSIVKTRESRPLGGGVVVATRRSRPTASGWRTAAAPSPGSTSMPVGRRRRHAPDRGPADGEPQFSFDGKTIVFESTRRARRRARLRGAGRGRQRRVRLSPAGALSPAASPTEDRVVFVLPTEHGRVLMSTTLEGARRRRWCRRCRRATGSTRASRATARSCWWCARPPRWSRSSSAAGRPRGLQVGARRHRRGDLRARRGRADRVGAAVERRPVARRGDLPLTDAIIRRATPADAVAVATIQVHGHRWAYAGLLPQPASDPEWIAQRTEVWRRLLADAPPRQGFLALRARAHRLRQRRSLRRARRCRRRRASCSRSTSSPTSSAPASAARWPLAPSPSCAPAASAAPSCGCSRTTRARAASTSAPAGPSTARATTDERDGHLRHELRYRREPIDCALTGSGRPCRSSATRGARSWRPSPARAP